MERQETEVPISSGYDVTSYQERAYECAVYGDGNKIGYPALGLVEEVGELLETGTEDTDSLVKEMGDVMWYAAALATDLGLSLNECKLNPKVQLVPDIEALFKNSHKIAGRVKKLLRGDAGQEDKVAEVAGRLGDIVRRIEVLAAQYGSSLEEVCDGNLDKLFDRKDRGVLKGDGDNR